MHKFERRTSLSIEELVVEYYNPFELPQCGVVNEIGVVFLQKTHESEKAEDFLFGLLNEESWENAVKALCYLMTPDEKDLRPETAMKINSFVNDRNKWEIVGTAKQMVSARKNLNF